MTAGVSLFLSGPRSQGGRRVENLQRHAPPPLTWHERLEVDKGDAQGGAVEDLVGADRPWAEAERGGAVAVSGVARGRRRHGSPAAPGEEGPRDRARGRRGQGRAPREQQRRAAERGEHARERGDVEGNKGNRERP